MIRLVSLLLSAVMLTACAGFPGSASDDDGSTPGTLSAGIWDVEAGEKLELDEFVARVDDARFVVVGESHGEPWHHEAQQMLYEAVVEHEVEVAVGMEMMERRFQQAVDAYLAEELDENALLSRLQWHDRWGVDEEYYAPMWRRARTEQLPVVALNARRELVSAVAEQGLDAVADEYAEELPEIDTSDPDYREHLRSVFAMHRTGGGDVEQQLNRFFQAQVVWDETMAETAWEFMEANSEIDVMLLLTGRGHMAYGFGIPPRLVRRGAHADEVVTMIPVSTESPRAAAMNDYRDLEYLRSEEAADYVWVEPSESSDSEIHAEM